MTAARTPPAVLVVDDDPDVLETVEAILDIEGYRVLTADNGARALELLRSGERPCVILLDLMMPTMSGWEFRTEQLKNGEVAGIPVVVFTGNRSADEESPLPGTETLSKPVTLETLLRTIQRFCGPAQP
ncbi:MAG: response regulator [Polyangiaceae bacterium]|nr:response regulator [Polyangiaceae bacterium]